MASLSIAPCSLTSSHPQLEKEKTKKGIKELVDNGIAIVPEEYIRPLHQRPTPLFSNNQKEEEEESIPVIDIAGLFGIHRDEVIREIGRACREWGFFQVVNHGFPREVMDSMWEAVDSFYKLPVEERMRLYSEDFNSEVAYMMSFNPSKESILEWREALYFRCLPGQYQNLKDSPEFCRLAVLDYLKELRVLGGNLYEAIFESLGVLKKDLPGIPRAIIAANYYPPCPDPSLTLGLTEHSDVSSFTILAQNEISGLEVLKNGRWVTIKPVPGAFVINLADQIQILSNGEYPSVEHRVVTNSKLARMSISCFFGPSEDTKIGPLPQLIDETHPPLYKESVFGDYVKNFYSAPLSSKWTIDFSKVSCIVAKEQCVLYYRKMTS